MLGFAVGAKSSTTPVYSAESTPKNIRGALTMMWQVRRVADPPGNPSADVSRCGQRLELHWDLSSALHFRK